MYKRFLCLKSGIKASDDDFRRKQPAVELCSIKNCEKLGDSMVNIRKLIQGDVSPHSDTGFENLLQKNGQAHKMRRYCWCLC